MSFVFNPPTGLNDETIFPDEDALIRQHIQTLLQQIPDYVDSQMASKTQQSAIAPTLLNSFTNLGSLYSTVRYYKDELGIVHLLGTLSAPVSNIGSLIFNLPVGYRPASTLLCNATGTIERIDIDASGNVRNGDAITVSGYLSLTGITFRAGVE